MKTFVIAILAACFGIILPAAYAEEGEEFTELLGVHLGKDTKLVDVQKRFGQTRLVETGESGEYEASICYFAPNCGTTVKFWSDELGGPKHNLIGFTLVRSANRASRCSLLPLDDCKALHLARGIRLGMQRHQFVEALGAKVEVWGERIYKTFKWRHLMSDEERRTLGISRKEFSSDLYWDFVVNIWGGFEADVLQSVGVSKTQTF